MPYLVFMLLSLGLLASTLYTPAQGEPAAWGRIHDTYIPAEQPGDWE